MACRQEPVGEMNFGSLIVPKRVLPNDLDEWSSLEYTLWEFEPLRVPKTRPPKPSTLSAGSSRVLSCDRGALLAVVNKCLVMVSMSVL